MNETIIGPATPPGQGAIAIIRVSGEKAFDITSLIFDNKLFSRKRKRGIYPAL